MSPVVEFGSDYFKAEGCYHPRVIWNDTLKQHLKVPCGSCLYCLRYRQSQWVARLVEHLRQFPGSSYFVTLTYRPEEIPVDPRSGLMQVCTDHIKKLNMDLRKRFQQGFFFTDLDLDIGKLREKISLPTDLKFKYYITSEYGPESGHPHYHSVYYNLPEDRYLVTLLFEQIWNKGFCRVYEASENTIGYITKYLVNSKVCDTYDSRFQNRPFSLMSKGLGLSYVDRMKDYHQADPLKRSMAVFHGEKSVLGRYWRDKIFTDDQKLLLSDSFQCSRSLLESKLEGLSDEQLALVNHARDKWQKDQEYAAEWITLKKHVL